MQRQSSHLTESPLEELHNYFELEVLAALKARDLRLDPDTFVDVLALALNELPARYIRHRVDLIYFTAPAELAALKQRIEQAIDHALQRLQKARPGNA